MANDEDRGFLDEMSDVVPLKREPRAAARGRVAARRDASLEQRRAAAEQGPPRDRNTLSEDGIAPLDAWYVLEFKRPGVQNGVFRKLRQGKYDSEARLDMHRMSASTARRELFGFIEESHLLGLRTVMVIHGKGQTSAEKALFPAQGLHRPVAARARHRAGLPQRPAPARGHRCGVCAVAQERREKAREPGADQQGQGAD